MLQLSGYQAMGAEADERASRFGEEQFGVQVTPGFFEEKVDSLGSYDCVLMLDVLEHLVDVVLTFEGEVELELRRRSPSPVNSAASTETEASPWEPNAEEQRYE